MDSTRNEGTLRRWAVRSFFICTVFLMSVNALPTSIALRGLPGRTFAGIADLLGISQGSWTMFAPNPHINNFWLSAEFYDEDGNLVDQWQSPFWGEVSPWEKFYRFRRMNYYSQLCFPQNSEAAEDFAEFLVKRPHRAQDGETSVRLVANSFELASPYDGVLHDPQDLVWVTRSQLLVAPEEAMQLEASESDWRTNLTWPGSPE